MASPDRENLQKAMGLTSSVVCRVSGVNTIGQLATITFPSDEETRRALAALTADGTAVSTVAFRRSSTLPDTRPFACSAPKPRRW